MESALVHLVKRSSSPVPWPYHAPTWYDGRIDAGKKIMTGPVIAALGVSMTGVFMTFFNKGEAWV